MREKARKVKIIVLDVDGTLTDGKLYTDNNGVETKAFNAKDGMAIAQGIKYGMKFAIVTGKNSQIVKARAQELGIEEVYQKVSNKIKVLDEILEKYKLTYEETAYMGDDINDIPAIMRVGMSGAPFDSSNDILQMVDFKSSSKGGKGAVREFVEYILREKGIWNKVLEDYRNKR
ncbi:KdsC family phosphatase [Ilyobacter polytropus]|uniref:3-deoxy-D-manno-octulosonate 8-phosphate phosphatase, YrbI family n=1 Tax=Ilyobacter polytropus (strain ATCC 51220 / DSM 2926 / LMG 16218 / CuHBu1) TaxID=572544 RepID=E3H935_ILYPC|nr:HAD-IIIA family hydrolase [Ilyobacter polytropus]ADO82007.1 3-deoxy-D-manno-octulosonate 8-phosphate phosphatase, YrbI family [Ilyobacter polytropus DSM 2926]